MSTQMLKLTRKNKRDFGCYSISKEDVKERKKKTFNEWRHHNLGMILNLNYSKKSFLHLSTTTKIGCNLLA
jgi:hypothetical protein